MFGRRKRSIERLLIVEDEPLVAFDNEHLLADDGYIVVATVDRVADAVRVIDGGDNVHLVLVDVNLSDGTGVDVARAAHAKGVPVLFVTGECPAGGRDFASGCLAKPYAQRDLLAAISAIDVVSSGGKAPRRLPGGLTLFEQQAV